MSEIGKESAQGLVGAWDSQNCIFFGQSGSFGLSLLPASGGTPPPFAKLEGHTDFDYPEVLPRGEWVLFTDQAASDNWSNANIVAQSVKTGERKLVIKGGHFARYTPTGHLVDAQSGNLFAVGFDAKRLETVGNAVPVVQDIGTNETSGNAQFAVAQNGTLIYIPASTITLSEMVWIDKEGKEQSIAAEPKNYRNPRISPDETRVAVTIESVGNTDIWI